MHEKVESLVVRELRLISLLVALTAVIIIGMSLTMVYFHGSVNLEESNKDLLIAELAVLGIAFASIAWLIWRTALHIVE